MKEIQRAVLVELLAKLNLERLKMQFGNDYVFGFDDVERLITREINELGWKPKI